MLGRKKREDNAEALRTQRFAEKREEKSSPQR